MPLRTCKRCNKRKYLTSFPKDKRYWLGYSYVCIDCNPKRKEEKKQDRRNKQKEYKIKNRAKILEAHKQYHKEHREQERQYCKEWKEQNKDKRYLKNRHKIEVADLTNDYLLNCIKRTYDLSREVLKQHPDLIESYRLQIKIKRLLKQKRHENIKTS